jgi:ParB family transcriptional regulator, chromosome partitioning protein
MSDNQRNREVEWVPTKLVIPNPLNPRKNDAIRTDEIQSIIEKRGFEEPLVAYQKGKYYVLLAGHRRLFAAKQVKAEEIPLYVVEAPKNEQEELERIASLQSGRVDWTPFEWAKFIYDRWLNWNRPPISRFAKEINQNPTAVKQYINVLGYFPRHEIEQELQSKTIAISSLDALHRWMKALKKNKPDLVEGMGEDMIRKIMLDKLIYKKVDRDELRDVEYTEKASEEKIREFLTDKEAVLASELSFLGIKRKYKDFNGHLISIGSMKNRIPNVKPENEHQRDRAVSALEELKEEIDKQLKVLTKQ